MVLVFFLVPSTSSGNTRGAAKKKMTKVTYICRSAKTKVVTYFTLKKGSSKTRKKKSEKIHLGSSQKMRLFFPPFFFCFALGCFDLLTSLFFFFAAPLEKHQNTTHSGL
jgi:hypothetical protein